MQHLSRLEITGCVRSMRSGESSGSVSLYVKRSGRSGVFGGEGEGASICMNNEAPRPAGMEATGAGEQLKPEESRSGRERRTGLRRTAAVLGVCDVNDL